ncbi:MAG: hypothetical protein KGJ43_09870, partial [Acidobacteriota bacterium]|nr:hypothetical protein [Acidobacteriota bacterium]
MREGPLAALFRKTEEEGLQPGAEPTQELAQGAAATGEGAASEHPGSPAGASDPDRSSAATPSGSVPS